LVALIAVGSPADDTLMLVLLDDVLGVAFRPGDVFAKCLGSNPAYIPSKMRSKEQYHTGPETPLTIFKPARISPPMSAHPSSLNLHARIPLATPFTIRLETRVGTPSLLHFSCRNWDLVFFFAAIDEKYAEMRKKVAMKKV
jgi:hypothetical protein